MAENRELMRVHFAIGLVHEGQVHAGYELDSGGLIRVIIATHDLQAVDTILVYSLCGWSDNVLRIEMRA